MAEQDPGTSRSKQLLKALENRKFRHSYMARQLKAFLAQQIRSLRGEMRQSEFGEKIGKPQSVISRLEKQMDKQVSVQTLIDIASSLDIAVVIRFVDFPTFLQQTGDFSESALSPAPYDLVPASIPPTQNSMITMYLDSTGLGVMGNVVDPSPRLVGGPKSVLLVGRFGRHPRRVLDWDRGEANSRPPPSEALEEWRVAKPSQGIFRRRRHWLPSQPPIFSSRDTAINYHHLCNYRTWTQ